MVLKQIVVSSNFTQPDRNNDSENRKISDPHAKSLNIVSKVISSSVSAKQEHVISISLLTFLLVCLYMRRGGKIVL